MIKKIQSIRGMKDYLPKDVLFWRRIEQKLIEVLCNYGYYEIRLPIIEQTKLFQRAIGSMTDVIEKEMYNFKDRHGNDLTLRPEGTAGCMRSIIEHDLLYKKKTNVYGIWVQCFVMKDHKKVVIVNSIN